VADLAKSAIPLMLASAGFRLIVLLDRTVASGLEQGDATLLRYSLFFLMSVQSILVMPLLNVGYNRLSALHSEGDEGAVAVVFSFLQVLWLLVVPATLALVLFAAPLVAFFLGRAAFDVEAVARTAHVLEAFAPALPFMVGYMIVLQAFLSRRRYLYVTALSIVIPFASFSVKLALGPRLGVRGVAFATAVTMAAWFLALLCPLWREAPSEARTQLRLRSGRVLLAAALTVALLWPLLPLLPQAPFPRLALGGASLGAFYASLVFLIARAQLVSLWREFKGTPLGA
jgi:putative peptidoglycan lipid II flippase